MKENALKIRLVSKMAFFVAFLLWRINFFDSPSKKFIFSFKYFNYTIFMFGQCFRTFQILPDQIFNFYWSLGTCVIGKFYTRNGRDQFRRLCAWCILKNEKKLKTNKTKLFLSNPKVSKHLWFEYVKNSIIKFKY